ncbi:LytTR family transcriptional regulator DNA-binding domain-containing protein [Eubacteriales bacterium OttesenSCG-928-M02]|nr:LytTR family transcriptional regulator DNA-binding domain-containing protein [Eubacteriales bacterium OttesenSCG-928-M02]
MKIRVEHGDFEENELVLRCRELDGEMLEVLATLRERSAKLTGYKDGETHMLPPAEVLYAEAVDGKTFLYTADAVLETHQSLLTLQEAYGETGLLRIGKSQLCNLHHVAKLKSLPNSRIEITLDNGEKLVVSRRYVQDLEERLGMADR